MQLCAERIKNKKGCKLQPFYLLITEMSMTLAGQIIEQLINDKLSTK